MVMVNCGRCHGAGSIPEQKVHVDKDGKATTRTEYRRCPECHGQGQIPGH